jgi:DNA (cytosine-5)-methyltransferase 1
MDKELATIDSQSTTRVEATYKPKIDSYFSGGGGLDLGLSLAGCDVKRSLEIDPTCCKTLALNFQHKIRQEDITQTLVLKNNIEKDVMAFTYPCKKYSHIAQISGTWTGDELFLHAFRHAAIELPEVIVLENVPGMRKFEIVMECFTKMPNYYVQVFCPIDANYWLPQNRKRLIIILTKKHFPISEPVPSNKRPQLKHIIEKGAAFEILPHVQARINGKYRDKPIISDPSKNDIAPTCVAHYSKDKGTRLIKDGKIIRPYTVREYARLQGFPDSYQFAGTENQQFEQIGNAVAVDMGIWIGEQVHRYFNRAA